MGVSNTRQDAIASTERRQELFARVKRDGLWGSTESSSGEGSTLAATKELREDLPNLIERLQIKSIFDVPCGDFKWMRHPISDLPSPIDYTGADLVDEMIAENIAQYSSVNIRFHRHDIVMDLLPEADLIFVRDLFIHFTLDLIIESLHNIASGEFRYLALTHDLLPERYPGGANIELDDGNFGKLDDGVSYMFRCLCMTLPPFALPAPIAVMRENPNFWDGGKCMAVWTREQIRSAGFGR